MPSDLEKEKTLPPPPKSAAEQVCFVCLVEKKCLNFEIFFIFIRLLLLELQLKRNAITMINLPAMIKIRSVKK